MPLSLPECASFEFLKKLAKERLAVAARGKSHSKIGRRHNLLSHGSTDSPAGAL
jgi:hypothetical protein